MHETPALMLALLAGCLLGTMFFGGLWWTVRKCVSSRLPAAWLLGSLLLRTALTLAGFHFAAQGDWRRLLACLLGFFLARVAATRLPRAPAGGTAP
jgi:F1F0 ATPase subunit 2